jgi:hypothetical protein
MQHLTVKERVKSHRNRLREAGFKPVQLWVTDPKIPGFAAECRRQSLIIMNDQAEMADLEQLVELADWGDE